MPTHTWLAVVQQLLLWKRLCFYNTLTYIKYTCPYVHVKYTCLLSKGSSPGPLLTIWQCSPPPATDIDREMLTLTKFTLKIFMVLSFMVLFQLPNFFDGWLQYGQVPACRVPSIQLTTRCWEGQVSLAAVVNQIHVFTSGGVDLCANSYSLMIVM